MFQFMLHKYMLKGVWNLEFNPLVFKKYYFKTNL